jgi:hypothetical protein
VGSLTVVTQSKDPAGMAQAAVGALAQQLTQQANRAFI